MGIENVYLMKIAGLGIGDNMKEQGTDILGIIENNTGSDNVPYETAFAIVIAFQAHTDNMAYVNLENVKVALQASGSFTIALENCGESSASQWPTGVGEVRHYSNYGTTDGWLQANAIWDNNGAGYKLPAGGTLNITTINLWGWD